MRCFTMQKKHQLTFLLPLVLLLPSCSMSGGGAPSFELPDTSGAIYKSGNYENSNLTMLHFWADWCDACRREFPKLQRNYTELQPQGLEIVAINLGQPKDVSLQFQKDFGITFPMLLDEQESLKDIYHIQVFPTNIIIDNKGKIIREIRGWADKTTLTNILQGIKANQN